MNTDEHARTEQIQAARSGDGKALAELFESYRGRLKNMIALRMDPRVQARVDASDVLQDAYMDLARRLPEYAGSNTMPFFLWVRMITGQRLTDLHRKHLGAAKRDAKKDISLQRGVAPEASRVHLVAQLAGQFTSVDRPMIRAEVEAKIQEALDGMDATHREILALRHFEELTTEETAKVLGLTHSGVLKRHTRALKCLRKTLKSCSGIQVE